MKTVKSTKRIDREDLGDCAVFTALGAIILMSIEFLVTASVLHYISTPILAVEGAAATAAGAVIATVAIKATDDED